SQDSFLLQSLMREISCHARPNLRKQFPENRHTIELCAIASFAPARVIPILLALACVAAHSLKMSLIERADPDISPRRRNRKRANARECSCIADDFTVRSDVTKCP